MKNDENLKNRAMELSEDALESVTGGVSDGESELESAHDRRRRKERELLQETKEGPKP